MEGKKAQSIQVLHRDYKDMQPVTKSVYRCIFFIHTQDESRPTDELPEAKRFVF